MVTILDPRTLLAVYRDARLDAPSRTFMQLGGYAANVQNFTTQDIVFEKITGRRRVAPFVHPTRTGVATWTRNGSRVETYRPAYIKPKDAVWAGEQFSRRSGDLLSDAPRTPEQNRDAEVAEVMAWHRAIIERRWEQMCAQAHIYGKVLVEYEDGDDQLVDFGRASNLTVTKTSNYWTDTYDVVLEIEQMCDRMREAEFGGACVRIDIGGSVWKKIRNNTKLKDLMDLNYKRSNVDIERGIVQVDRNSNVRFLGLLGEGIELWLNQDFYEDANGNQVFFMRQGDVVFTGADPGGVMAFGAIMDHEANLQAVSVFPKMWMQPDPSGIFIMTQSAPLPIPVYPNRTARIANAVPVDDSNSPGL